MFNIDGTLEEGSLWVGQYMNNRVSAASWEGCWMWRQSCRRPLGSQGVWDEAPCVPWVRWLMRHSTHIPLQVPAGRGARIRATECRERERMDVNLASKLRRASVLPVLPLGVREGKKEAGICCLLSHDLSSQVSLTVWEQSRLRASMNAGETCENNTNMILRVSWSWKRSGTLCSCGQAGRGWCFPMEKEIETLIRTVGKQCPKNNWGNW